MGVSMPVPAEGQGSWRAERLVSAILGCLCERLSAAGRGVCCCHWRRAQETLMPDACACTCGEGQGVAWVRIVERVFGEATPVERPRSRAFDGGFCGPAGAGEVWQMEAGVSRCWPEDADGMSCEEHSVAAADGAWDDELLFQALACCEDLEPFGVELERIRTLGPQGGCVASVAEFTARPVPRRMDQGADGPMTLAKSVPAPRRRGGFGR